MISALFSKELYDQAKALIEAFRHGELRLTTAESCTGGLLAALLTEIPGSSDVLDRGFVTYSNAAKQDMLAVPAEIIAEHGAVSEAVVRAMAEGALDRSQADVAMAITGIAGPGGGRKDKSVGLVWFGLAMLGNTTHTEERRFDNQGRSIVRLEAVRVALEFLTAAAGAPGKPS